MFVNSKTLRPTGISSSGVMSTLPFFHFTNGIGEPTAMQVKLRLAPRTTSFSDSGGLENCGGTRRTFTYSDVGFECSVPIAFSANASTR